MNAIKRWLETWGQLASGHSQSEVQIEHSAEKLQEYYRMGHEMGRKQILSELQALIDREESLIEPKDYAK